MAEDSTAHDTLTPSVVEGARRRDPEAVVAVYRALSAPVYSFLLRQTRDRAWAEDLTAEVFLEVLRSLDRFEGTPEGLRAWVFRIARNTLIDHVRRESRRRHEPLETSPEAAAAPELRVDPEAQALSNLERQRIVALVDELPPDQREVVLLRLVADLPIAQVAELVGKSPGAVKALQHRALRRLARRLGMPGGEEGEQ